MLNSVNHASTTPLLKDDSLFSRLKVDTQKLHQEIEVTIPIFKPHFSQLKYREYLERLFGYYCPIEDNIQDFISRSLDHFNFAQRSKRALLRADLFALGIEDNHLSTLPICRNVPAITSAAQLVGTLYVLEGSTLGGQVIRKLLKKRFAFEDTAMGFFNAYGTQTYDMWNDFKVLALKVVSLKDYDEVLSQAQQTFSTLEEWLRENLA